MSTQENIKIVRRAIEAVNIGDTSNVHEFISPEYVNRESQKHKDSYRSRLKEPEEFMDKVKNLRGACPDLHFEEQETIARNNKVAFVGNVTGTQTGNFFFVPPTGNKISYEAVHIFTIGSDGKIVEHRPWCLLLSSIMYNPIYLLSSLSSFLPSILQIKLLLYEALTEL